MSLTQSFRPLAPDALSFPDSRGELRVLYESGGLVLKGSQTRQGVFRGLHSQDSRAPQMKIIRVVSGKIIDFAVDVETRHARYMTVTADTGWVVVGSDLAHGFYAVEDTEFEYICHGDYAESCEHSYSILDFLEKQLSIKNVELSAKDSVAQRLEIATWESLDEQ